LICGSRATGDFSGEPVRIEVRMPYEGDLTLDASESDFDIDEITAYDSDNAELTDTEDEPSVLTVRDLSPGGDYTFVIEGEEGQTGTFDVTIRCSSDSPTNSPSEDPTKSPTPSPSANPSASPTTPAPTHPNELICGSSATGDFSGDPVEIEVRMPYAGDLTLDASESDFGIDEIRAYDSDGTELADTESARAVLTVRDLSAGGDYTFVLTGAKGKTGTFDVAIRCSSDSPTNSPSRDPTPNPTPQPSQSPTDRPTTPSPTHPGELTCNSHATGSYSGEPVQIEVRMPYDGDLTVDASPSDFEVTEITATDSSGQPLQDVDEQNADVLTVRDLRAGGDFYFEFSGAPDVTGTFEIDIYCSSDEPTSAPTDEPTENPSASPTTPSPTHPGELICGSHVTGDYSGDIVEFEVRMPHEGDLTVDASDSDFAIEFISARDADNNDLTDVAASPSEFTSLDIPEGDYQFKLFGEDGAEGTFDLKIVCSSDSPTPQPTTTTSTSTSSTTPSPTHPGELICGSHVTGDYSGDRVEFEVRMPHEGDLTVDASDSDFAIEFISARDADNNDLTDVATSPSEFTSLDIPEGDYQFKLFGEDGAEGTFDLKIVCSSDSPTPAPSENPSASPVTPSPTHPGELICGSHVTGDYSGDRVEFEVRMPHEGDLTVDASDSDFGIEFISARDADNNELTDVGTSPSTFTAVDISEGDYQFKLFGEDGAEGTFDLKIVCSSDSPTASPTTPAPTHPGELICGSHVSGDYSGTPVEIEVMMPYSGDMTLDASASDFGIASITAYDEDNDVELTDVDKKPSMLTVHDLSANGNYLFTIEGAKGKTGTFDVVIECSSDSPTPQPTTSTSTTTPPMQSEKMKCGGQKSGQYSAPGVRIDIEMPYDGDLTLDASDSDFDIERIAAYDEGVELKAKSKDTIKVNNLLGGTEYSFVIEGADYVKDGTWSVSVTCAADSPYTTPAPTEESGGYGKECSKHTDCNKLQKCEDGVCVERPGEGDACSKNSDCKKGQKCYDGECLEKKPEQDPSYDGTGCCVPTDYATKSESAKCYAHGDDKPKCEKHGEDNCAWDEDADNCAERVANNNGCCAAAADCAASFAPTCRGTEDKEKCMQYESKGCEWRMGETADCSDDSYDDDEDGCCAQTNSYASDKEMAICAKQTKSDSCGALAMKGCEWREGKYADCDGVAEMFSDVKGAAGADSTVTGWNVLLFAAAAAMVFVVYRCHQASSRAKFVHSEEEGRPLLGNLAQV